MEDLFGFDSGATFSEDKKHRKCLWRIWDSSKPMVMFIGLNPSTANADTDDPTIQSVVRLSKFNGYGGFYMMNCWSFIATKPEHLDTQVGNDDNMALIQEIANKCADVVLAWGNFKIVADHRKDEELIALFPNAKCITRNKNGSPGHPLFKKGTIKFTPISSTTIKP